MHQFAGEGHECTGLKWAQLEQQGVESSGASGRAKCVHSKNGSFHLLKRLGWTKNHTLGLPIVSRQSWLTSSTIREVYPSHEKKSLDCPRRLPSTGYLPHAS